MSYVLTDDDFNKLFVVKNQLGFLSSLLSTARTVQCDAEEIDSMFCALKAQIKNLMDSLDAREEVSRLAECMRCHDWARLIDLVSGRNSMSVKDIVKLDDKMAVCMVVDPDMRHVFNAWRAVITSDGKNKMMTTDNDMGGFQVKFDRPTPPELRPVTEQSILDMYGAKNPKDLVNRMVAMGNGADPAQLWEETQKEKTKCRKRKPVAA